MEAKKLGRGVAAVDGLAKAAETEKVWRSGGLAGLTLCRGVADSGFEGSEEIANLRGILYFETLHKQII